LRRAPPVSAFLRCLVSPTCSPPSWLLLHPPSPLSSLFIPVALTHARVAAACISCQWECIAASRRSICIPANARRQLMRITLRAFPPKLLIFSLPMPWPPCPNFCAYCRAIEMCPPHLPRRSSLVRDRTRCSHPCPPDVRANTHTCHPCFFILLRLRLLAFGALVSRLCFAQLLFVAPRSASAAHYNCRRRSGSCFSSVGCVTLLAN
jgi:hypothetical protein